MIGSFPSASQMQTSLITNFIIICRNRIKSNDVLIVLFQRYHIAPISRVSLSLSLSPFKRTRRESSGRATHRGKNQSTVIYLLDTAAAHLDCVCSVYFATTSLRVALASHLEKGSKQ